MSNKTRYINCEASSDNSYVASVLRLCYVISSFTRWNIIPGSILSFPFRLDKGDQQSKDLITDIHVNSLIPKEMKHIKNWGAGKNQ